MQPCIVDGVLAPTRNQRLGYKKWLHIYEKDLVFISPQMAKLQREYTVSYIIKLAPIFDFNILIRTQFQLSLQGVIPTIAIDWLSQFLSQVLCKMLLISPINLPILGH